MDDLYRIAREVTDDVMGPGTYADVNRGNSHPRVRQEVVESELAVELSHDREQRIAFLTELLDHPERFPGYTWYEGKADLLRAELASLKAERVEHEANRRMKERYMIPVNDPTEIPEFKSESEEADWWDSHEITDELWDKLPPIDRSVLPAPRSRRISGN